jgi:hypothetical protein
MWKKLKHAYREFAEDKPGERFLNAHERWKDASLLARLGLVAAGFVLVVIGVLLGLVPGVPGIVLGVLGLALIATRFRRMSVWLDWSEIKLRKFWRRCRRRFAHR